MKLITVMVSVLAFSLAAAAGCDRDEQPAGAGAADGAPAQRHAGRQGEDRVVTTQSLATTQAAAAVRVVFLGDSLTAGLGVDADQAFPSLIEKALQEEGLPAQVVNGGVSGDTTAGGLRRLDWLLRQKPDVVVVGLGGNDGLRGLDPKASEENLRAIVRKSRDAGADVLLLGMLIPPNYGTDYANQFRAMYPRLAKELNVPLVPFVLEGVGGETSLNQADGIHPTAEGHRLIAANILPHLRPLVRKHPAQ
jgi:acyl-CoA thioesterase-1